MGKLSIKNLVELGKKNIDANEQKQKDFMDGCLKLLLKFQLDNKIIVSPILQSQMNGIFCKLGFIPASEEQIKQLEELVNKE